MDLQSIKQRFGIIGNAPSLNRAIQTAMQVAGTDISVLIWGESGVGKEVFSQIIHQMSHRKHSKFIAVNCGAIPEGTIDSELFGHEKGSFTGAHDARKGYFETVNGGTIFLDEVGEMPVGTQARLLRLLETGEYIRVGSSQVQKTDVRVIAATNADLHGAISRNKFREDLYYRLNTVTIMIPALRERKEDIYLLFRKFASDFAEKYRTQPIQLDEEARLYLTEYAWPGNIRQLKNVTEQISVLETSRYLQGKSIMQYLPPIPNRSGVPAIVPGSAASSDMNERDIMYKLLFDMKKDLSDLKQVVARMLQGQSVEYPIVPEPATASLSNLPLLGEASETEHRVYQPEILPVNSGLTNASERFTDSNQLDFQEVEENLSLDELERKMILTALKKHQGKRKHAAQELGISERTLYRKIKEYGLD